MKDASAQTLEQQRQTFLWFAGWKDAIVRPLTGDASPRRYFRVSSGTRSAIFMDASLNTESLAPFIQIDEHLRKLGFHAPKILARDPALGWLLLEDFGDQTFSNLLEAGADPRELYTLGTDVLVALHQKTEAIPAGLRAYDPARMLQDIELFLEWRTPGISTKAADEFRKVWSEALPAAHCVPSSLLLRDYHVANLMLLSNETGLQRAGLLDFQDAYAGPVTYDLISLLEDARRELPPGLREDMLQRYVEKFPALDRDAFATSLAVVAAQRHTRVLAIFERLSRRDAKHDYRRLHSPRVERRLQTALEHPMLAGVKNWMNRHAGQN